GNVVAMFNLGIIYQFGQGVAKNPESARKWFHRAALRGDAAAQNSLGALYWYDKSYERAAKWFLLAQRGGDERAKANYANLLAASRPGFDALAQRLADVFRVQPADMTPGELKGWLEAYRSAFGNAKTAEDYRNFVIAYEDDDPERLVPQAQQRASQPEQRGADGKRRGN
ncbi:MAG TPA: hypothetical protein VF795_05750, partial [Desulfuromonadaceae bacterium]